MNGLKKKKKMASFYASLVEFEVQSALTRHVYNQTFIALVASLICASIIFAGLILSNKTAEILYITHIWYSFFLAVTIVRAACIFIYHQQRHPENHLILWKGIYVIGAILGGLSWGALSLLLTEVGSSDQVLIILMLAGVTAGVVPLSAGTPLAAIAFLVFSILPFIISISLFENRIYQLFDLALSLYLIYCIVLTILTYRLIKNSTILKFENDILLKDLAISNEKLHQAATHDPLTHLANRRLFSESLNAIIKEARINHHSFAIIYFDIDKFKLINDYYGHRVGDHVLLIISQRLINVFGKDKNLARLGGDEFALIIENAGNRDKLESIAKKIGEVISIPILFNKLKLNVTSSIGISIYPDDGVDEESLLRQADKLMYFSKEQGGNTFCFNLERIPK